MSQWVQGLNPEQAEAVQHNAGPMLILAGAGAGKTTVLVSRTGRLISEKIVHPKEILVLTFTNKAARELKHRVSVKIGNASKEIQAGTFHSFGLKLLRENHDKVGLGSYFGIADQSDCNSIIKELLKETISATKEKFDTDLLLNLISEKRIHGKFKSVEASDYLEMAEALTPKYLRRLQKLGVVDFEGLLLMPLELFHKHPEVLDKYQDRFQQVMVDEFQDTNTLQMDLIRALVRKHNNVSVVGDDDQSIYGWRGAEIQNILQFPREFDNCKVVKLERNYRSTPEIISLANEIISKNKTRHGKVLIPSIVSTQRIKPELFILDDEDEEAEFIVREIQTLVGQGYKRKDIAILYRSNMQGGFFESALRRNQIDYTITGGTSIFDRKEVKDIFSYLKYSVYPNEISLRRIINVPQRGLGDTTLDKIEEFAEAQKISYIEACKKNADIDISEKAKVALTDLLKLMWTLPQELLNNEGLGKTPGERLINKMIELGYRETVAKTCNDAATVDKKWITVEILGRILDAFFAKRPDDIGVFKEFIDAMSLRDTEDDDEKTKDSVQLMTFHASKGLEFPVVLLAGVEEDLIPHRSLGSDIDEERRLFYVGVTRAKQKLILSRCLMRKRHGVSRPVAPSRFIVEIDDTLFTQSASGFRPVTGASREALVGDFLAKLNEKSQNKSPSKI